jgi:TBC1 domain family member 15
MTTSKGQTFAGNLPSPSASFYDVSDDDEGEYATIAHSRSGKGVKLLFSKSKV